MTFVEIIHHCSSTFIIIKLFSYMIFFSDTQIILYANHIFFVITIKYDTYGYKGQKAMRYTTDSFIRKPEKHCIHIKSCNIQSKIHSNMATFYYFKYKNYFFFLQFKYHNERLSIIFCYHNT